MDKQRYDLKVHFSTEDNSLFELGYISIDLFHLTVFAELLENEDNYNLDKLFFYPKRGYLLTRNSPILNEYKDIVKIKNLKDGSIEIVLSGLSLTAAIIMPIVAVKVQENIRRESERITFEISAEDPQLSTLIDDFSRGDFGHAEDDFNWLLDTLGQLGYNVQIIAQDIYRVSKIIKGYERRIVKTLKKKY